MNELPLSLAWSTSRHRRGASRARGWLRVAGAASALCALVACVTNPSAEEVVNKTTPTICAKTKECSGDAKFTLAFPGGVDECVTKTKDEFRKKNADKLDATSVCTDDEVDKCMKDFSAAACGAGGALPPVPCGC